jgi:AhpD family alkylhydroperoxidase
MIPRLDYASATPAGIRALGAVYSHVERSSLPEVLVILVYLRASQINGCAYCIDMHSRDLRQRGMSIDKLVLLSVWRESGSLFDATERAALAWTESVTCVSTTGIPDEDYEVAAAAFEPRDLADLTIAIGLINAYNRLAIGFRTPPAAAAVRSASDDGSSS